MIAAINPLYSIAGVLVGMLVGMTGVGGGSLMTPLLVIVFGFHPVTAVGTDLLYAAATKSVGTIVHGRHGSVDWRVVRRLATGSVPATIVTLLLLSRFGGAAGGSGGAVATILGGALIVTAVAILFRARIVARLGPRFDGAADARIGMATVGLGVVLGALVSLTSVGAGALGMTALLVLYPRLPVRTLVGSDIAHAVPLTLIAGVGHVLVGSVDGALLLSLLIGSVPGIVAGSLLATRVSDRVLVPLLAVTLSVVGAKLLL